MTHSIQSLRTPQQLGLLLRSARKARQLTQSQLALRLGVSQSRVSQLELQPKDMTLEQVLSACAALGLELTVADRAGLNTEVASTRRGSSQTALRETSAGRSAKTASPSVPSPRLRREQASLAAQALQRKPRKGSW
ncbi:helix-turn-helix domain-containing protein [Hydrogenophaga sp. BPS33]|uniref:helix-turn-helix domain-containing protein n=1 Tax=Hydrogenophaga sp. BPS33 TaxID=2651974 RepID=UPI00131F8B39|nr:helix-turn-helix domain-containing protein [Hydrogenophaga sp. BPS33]